MQRKDPVTLTQEEQKRLRVIGEVEAGRWTATRAAEVLHLSARQVRRLRSAYRGEGAAAFAHGNRGRPSPRRLPDELRAKVRALGAGPFAACNDSHLRELLLLREGIALSRASVQRIRRAAGQKPKQRRRPPRHRSRRDRRPQEGMLLQVDGSTHSWLGQDQPSLCLLAAIDDATSKVVAAVFRQHEDAQGYFLLLRQVLQTQGIPLELYHDRHSIFENNAKRAWTLPEELAGQREPTQFGRALAELGIASIPAHSPEAKGRIERFWGTWQDRLAFELELEGIKDLKGANRFLPGFLARHNASFSIAAEEPGLAYRPLEKALDLDKVLSFRYQRVVARNNTVRLESRLIQIPPGPQRRSYFAARVWVHEFLDGSLGVRYQDAWLVRGPAGKLDALVRARRRRPAQPERSPIAKLAPPAQQAPLPQPPPTPPKPHPWRRYASPGYFASAARTESLSS
jgi:hypothetical protein